MTIPLFPLNALVCPSGRLPLRIFEPRYLDMVRKCLREGSSFVVVMLKKGGREVLKDGESTSVPDMYHVGTCVKIVDFDQGSDGILGVVVEGTERVAIQNRAQQDDGLWLGEVSVLTPEQRVALPDEFNELSAVLKALVQHPVVRELNLEIDYQDASQVGWRLTELLPLDNAEKQSLYELDDPIHRLELISDQLDLMSA